MSRDYAKKSNTRKKTKKSHLATWIILLLSLAMFFSAMVFIKKNGHSKHKLEQKITKVKKTIANSIAKTKFDFHNISQKKSSEIKKGLYELEIDTVNNFATADRLKAELILSGFTVKTKSILKGGRQKYYISTGPYDSKKAALADQKRLKRIKFESSLRTL